jgi:hypothetical protein
MEEQRKKAEEERLQKKEGSPAVQPKKLKTGLSLFNLKIPT